MLPRTIFAAFRPARAAAGTATTGRVGLTGLGQKAGDVAGVSSRLLAASRAFASSSRPANDGKQSTWTARTTTKQSLRRLSPVRPAPQQVRAEPAAKPCVAVSSAQQYDLPKVLETLHQQGHLSASMLLPQEVAYVEYPLANGRKADTFVLSNGSIVTFGMTETETIALAEEIKVAERLPYPARESEDMDFVDGPADNDARSYMDGELIVLCGNDRQLDMAAFATGLARSTKLAVLESALEQYIQNIRDATDRLATGRKLPMHGTREVLKKTGELLRLRGNLNLYSELTETPDLYWSEPELETIYRAISKNLDIAPRIAILNKKLDYASEVVSILKAHLSEEQSIRLEWMIIILIMVEVLFEISHFAERYLASEERGERAERAERDRPAA
ncbi:uncharacterized protein V1510DRAFT_422471 [Dipodascopsis tothii]|uniref:uncharacterized protein n=1 Tax=Dipodascopsis tothii TaxID=44089 RepID=UPI0034CD1ABA